jgi:hypothetical protein
LFALPASACELAKKQESRSDRESAKARKKGKNARSGQGSLFIVSDFAFSPFRVFAILWTITSESRLGRVSSVAGL